MKLWCFVPLPLPQVGAKVCISVTSTARAVMEALMYPEIGMFMLELDDMLLT